MKYALVNGEKIEALKGAHGLCPSCGSALIAKCGDKKINHWAHKGNRDCDSWWENETEWHRSWKGEFPKEWQEVVRFSDSGEKHIADVKTESGWVLEFQHSFLKSEERCARNDFYKKIVWVVDGLRRETDIKQLENAINESTIMWKNPLILKVQFPKECRLLTEWHNSQSYVFFDIGGDTLWFLFPKSNAVQEVCLAPYSRIEFIKNHNNDQFDKFLIDIINLINESMANAERARQEEIFIRNQQAAANNYFNNFDIRGTSRRFKRF